MVHNGGESKYRMPLFLPIEMAREWIDEGLNDDKYKEILDYEMPSDQIEYYPVYTIRTSKPRPDNRMKNEPWEWKNYQH